MGIPNEPPPDYGMDCTACFAAGKTPDAIWCSITGIKRGSTWIPAWDDPPKGRFLMNQYASCKWRTAPGWPFCNLELNLAGDSFMQVILQIPGTCFQAFSGSNCGRLFKNIYDVYAGNAYYGGKVIVIPVRSPPKLSIQSIAESVSIPVEDDTMSEFWPTKSDELLMRYARVPDSINVLVKHDGSNP